jgi:DNA-binding NarL/FixJ family response regulator
VTREPLSVLIIDDHPIFIDALKIALQPMLTGARILGAQSLIAATETLQSTDVDLILLDLMLPDAGGVESVARIRDLAPCARVVIVSGRDDPVTVSLAKAVGAEGFISKADPLTRIQNHLKAIISGASVFPATAGAVGLADAISRLTPAQARVLAAAATGKLNKQIAYDMNLAEPTVKAHMSAIFKRLGVTNRTQAILAVSVG